MSNSKVSIKSFDIVFSFIKTISIEDLGDFVSSNSTSHINVKVDLERMEVASSDNNLSLPILEIWDIEISVDSNSSEESSIG